MVSTKCIPPRGIKCLEIELLIEIENDYTVYGDEASLVGCGKTIRDGMAQSATLPVRKAQLDFVITSGLSVLIIGELRKQISESKTERLWDREKQAILIPWKSF